VPYTMSVVYLIRHGQASFGHDNYDRLSDLGVRQAELLGEYFSKIKVAFDAVYSGSLERQVSSANAVLSKLPEKNALGAPRILPEFNEFSTYSAYMNQLAELMASDPAIALSVRSVYSDRGAFKRVSEEVARRWRSTDASFESGDTWQAFCLRIRAGFEKIRAENGPGKNVGIFTSGGTIAASMQLALELTDGQAMQLPRLIRNTSVSTFLYDEARFSLSSFNAIPHLELETDPTLITLL
jgi:broad specificity phosphatase PhoE